MAVGAVGRANGEDQLPLSEENSIGRKQRCPRIVNARSFRGSAIELDDLKISSGTQVRRAIIANVEAADIKAREGARSFVDLAFERFRPEMAAIAEYAPLGMVTRFDELESCARGQDLMLPIGKPLQVCMGNQSSPSVGSNQFLDRLCSIAGDERKNLLRDGENLSARLVRKAKEKNTRFLLARGVTLKNHRGIDLLQVVKRIAHRSHQADAVAALTDVRFQN